MKDAEFVEGQVEGQIVECTGTVEYFHENPHGDVDGIYLGDGSEIRFPPHLGGHFYESLHFGQEIYIEATVHITKHGDIHWHAHRIVDSQTNEVLLEKERHVHKPRKGSHEHRPTNGASDEVVRELKAIRKLLEAQLQRP